MEDVRRVSICIPTYQRFELTVRAFEQVIDDYRVAEVVIVDDASGDGSYNQLLDKFQGHSKVKLFRNMVNKDCYFNKREAIYNCSNEFCVLLDSDNKIDVTYIDAIFAIENWDEHTFFQAEWSRPAFDFRRWQGLKLTKENIAQYTETDLMTMCNACNYFINRDEYLRIWDSSINPMSSDSIYFSYCWLKAGNKILITPNLQYDHMIHPNGDNHFTQNQAKTVGFHNNLMDKIRQLK